MTRKLKTKSGARKLAKSRANRLRRRTVHRQLIEAELNESRSFGYGEGSDYRLRFDPSLLKALL